MRIGIIGAGMIGGTLAKLWTGHQVCLASRNPDRLAPLVAELGDRASAGRPVEAAEWGDVVLLAIPFSAAPKLSDATKAALAGKVVIDAGNPFGQRDGEAAAEVARAGTGSGRWTASHLPGARVVKAFNTVYYQRMLAREGVGVPVASDDPAAIEFVEGLVRDAGMEPVVVGGLDRVRDFDPGTDVWNSGMTADQLRAALKV